MHCQDCQKRLSDLAKIDSDTNFTPEVVLHLSRCQSCRDFSEDLILKARMSAALVPAMRRDFIDESLRRARQGYSGANSDTHIFRYAVAASFFLAALTLWFLGADQAPDPSSPQIVGVPEPATQQAGIARRVDFILEADENLEALELLLSTEGGIKLTRFPARQSIKWVARLVRGKNLLSVPVTVMEPNGGILEINYYAAGSKQRFRVKVDAESVSDPSSLLAFQF